MRKHARRIKRKIGKYPAMVLPPGSWFIEVPPDLAAEFRAPGEPLEPGVPLIRGEIGRLLE